jgi:hypothetical protein
VGRQAQVTAQLNATTERLQSTAYQSCMTTTQAAAAVAAFPARAGVTVEVLGVRYLSSSGTTFDQTCSTDRGAQLVTLRASAQGSPTPVLGQVVVRNPSARGS